MRQRVRHLHLAAFPGNPPLLADVSAKADTANMDDVPGMGLTGLVSHAPKLRFDTRAAISPASKSSARD